MFLESLSWELWAEQSVTRLRAEGGQITKEGSPTFSFFLQAASMELKASRGMIRVHRVLASCARKRYRMLMVSPRRRRPA